MLKSHFSRVPQYSGGSCYNWIKNWLHRLGASFSVRGYEADWCYKGSSAMIILTILCLVVFVHQLLAPPTGFVLTWSGMQGVKRKKTSTSFWAFHLVQFCNGEHHGAHFVQVRQCCLLTMFTEELEWETQCNGLQQNSSCLRHGEIGQLHSNWNSVTVDRNFAPWRANYAVPTLLWGTKSVYSSTKCREKKNYFFFPLKKKKICWQQKEQLAPKIPVSQLPKTS